MKLHSKGEGFEYSMISKIKKTGEKKRGLHVYLE